MQLHMKYFLFTAIGLMTCVASAQADATIIDSILNISEQQPNDSLQIDYLNRTFFDYCYQKPQIAKQLSLIAIEKSKKVQNQYLLFRALLRKGVYHDIVGEKDSALIAYDKVLERARPIGDQDAVASALNNKGLIYWNEEDYDKAMEQYLESYKIFNVLGQKRGQGNNLNNIGLILFDLERYQEALSYHRRSLKLKSELKDDYGMAAVYTNMSKNYAMLQQNDSAIQVLHKAIPIKQKIDDLRGLAIAYNNLGLIMGEIGLQDSTIYYLGRAEEIYRNLDLKKLRGENLFSLGRYNVKAGRYTVAINNFERSLELMSEKDFDTRQRTIAHLADAYFKTGNYKLASENYQESLRLKDSIAKQNVLVQTQDIFEKYNSAEKEKEIQRQRADLAEQDLILQRRNYEIIGLLALILVVASITYLIYKQQKAKAERLRLKANLAQIETQNKLQEQRLQISRDLHDNIGSQLTFIISSLENMKYSFELPKKLEKKLGAMEVFASATMTDLRDTIWAMDKNEISISDLRMRISDFVKRAKEATQEISFRFEMDEKLDPEHAFSSKIGINIYRILQEAVNNAIKHAKATEIAIHLNQVEDGLQMSIMDKGKGFNLNQVIQGNGLNNMKKRAAGIGATLNVESQKEKGTRIILELPINTANVV